MSRIEFFNDHNLRVLKIADLGSMLATDAFEGRSMPDIFDEFYPSETDHKTIIEIGRIVSKYEKCPEDVSEALYNKGFHGLMVQFGTPVRDYYRDEESESHRFSWGHYYTAWIYADTYDQAIQLAGEWVETCKANDKAKREAK